MRKHVAGTPVNGKAAYLGSKAPQPHHMAGHGCSDVNPTGHREIAGSMLAESATFFHGNLTMKYFLQSFSPFCWFKKGSCQILAKECAQYW